MPDLDNRRRHEAALAGAAALLFFPRRPLIREGIFDEDDFVEEWTDTFAPRFERVHRDAFNQLTSREDVEADPTKLSQRFADRFSKKLGKEIARKVATKLRQAKRETGEARDEALDRLAKEFNRGRARDIGITEVTRGISFGERDAVDRIERIAGRTLTAYWVTSLMANVCKICKPLHRKRAAIWRRRFPFGPPAHPNCLLPGSLIDGKIEAACKSFYSGQAVQLFARSGVSLSITPHHPVLTDQGFIPAGQLRKGDRLVRHYVMGKPPCSVPDNHHQAPSFVEDIFGALAQRSYLQFRSDAAAIDFHGDGEFINGQIDVVSTDGMLLTNGATKVNHGRSEFCFVRRNVKLPSEVCLRTFDAFARARLSSPSGLPSISQLPANLSTVPFHGLPGDFGLLGCGSYLDPVFDENTIQAGEFSVGQMTASRDSQLGSQLIDRFPGFVAFDDLIKIRNFQWSGHVYDLQSLQGWYVSNGIIVHNCNCFLEYS